MAKPPAKKKELVLHKHRGAIHISGKLSLMQRKLALALLHNAYWELPDPRIMEHTISIRKIAKLVGIAPSNRERLRAAIKSLTTYSIEWDILNEKGNGEWGVSTFLAGAKIKKGSGICTYSYSPFLREKLCNPKHFARINLSAVSQMHGTHALALYECCALYKDWLPGTGMHTVGAWKKLLGVGDRYSQFKRFNDKVLKPAIREVNLYTDIEIYDVQVERRNRRIVKLGFKARTNPQLNLFLEYGEDEQQALSPALDRPRQGDMPQDRGVSAPPHRRQLPGEQDALTEEERALCRAMSDCGISPGRHQEILSQCSADQIRDNLAYVSAKARKGEKVKNWGAYAASAILRDYAGTQKGEPTIQREIEQQKQAEVRRRQEKARAEEARQREEDKRLEEQREWTIRAQEHFDTWPEDKQVRFDAEVRADLIAQGELDPANPYGGVLVRTTRLDRIANMLRAENGAER